MLRLRVAFPILMFIAMAMAAGCGGGGGGGSSTPAVPVVGPSASVSIGPSAPPPVTLTAGGYVLTFLMPAETTGSTSTISAVFSTSLPNGVVAPQTIKRSPKTIGTTTTALVYLSISTTAQVGFASRPSLTFTLPNTSVIPNGAPTYVIFYDPANGTWIPWLNASVSGYTVTVPGASGGFTLTPTFHYVVALAYTTQAVATPTPAPAPTPRAGSTPQYCANYKPATGSTVAINLTDDSGLGGTPVFYVYNGTAKMYMDATGGFTSSSAVPLPAVCFATSPGVVADYSIPISYNGYTAGAPLSGRILVAYAPGPPKATDVTAPNPLPSGVGTNPNYSSAMLPWDTIEFAIPNGVVDTTQVNFLGLPVELSVTQSLPHQTQQTACPTIPIPASAPVPAIVGFSSCGFRAAFTDIYNNANYQPLLISEPIAGSANNGNYELRILSPDSLSFAGFDWYGLETSPAKAPLSTPCTASNTGTGGYLQCVLAYYQMNPQVFTSNIGAGASGHWYCATSDGSQNFIFTDVGPTKPTACPATPYTPSASSANPFKLSLSTLTYGQAPLKDDAGCQYAQLFQQPYGTAFVDNQPLSPTTTTGTGNLFQTLDAFALWKGLVADLNYGQAVQSTFNGSPAVHPGGAYPSPAPSYTNYWHDPFWNYYAQVLHHYANGGYAYALAYDDLYGWSTSISVSTSTINLRVNAVPTSTYGVLNNPTPVGNPPACPSIPPEIGSY